MPSLKPNTGKTIKLKYSQLFTVILYNLKNGIKTKIQPIF